MSVLKYLLLTIATPVCAAFAQVSPDDGSAAHGKGVYEQHCLACHQADGSGAPFLAPPLIEGEFVNGSKPHLINIVLNGMEGVEIKGELYANPMPAFDFLSDRDIADVLTFIRTNFENAGGSVTADDVKLAREA